MFTKLMIPHLFGSLFKPHSLNSLFWVLRDSDIFILKWSEFDIFQFYYAIFILISQVTLSNVNSSPENSLEFDVFADDELMFESGTWENENCIEYNKNY